MAAFPRFQAAWILFYKRSPLRRMVHMLLLRPQPSEWLYEVCRTFRDFRGLTNVRDPIIWWKAGLSLAAVTAFGLIVAKFLHTSEKSR